MRMQMFPIIKMVTVRVVIQIIVRTTVKIIAKIIARMDIIQSPYNPNADYSQNYGTQNNNKQIMRLWYFDGDDSHSYYWNRYVYMADEH